MITGENDMEHELTEVCETISEDALESVFYGWMSRLE
jgi:hypothetical protein